MEFFLSTFIQIREASNGDNLTVKSPKIVNSSTESRGLYLQVLIEVDQGSFNVLETIRNEAADSFHLPAVAFLKLPSHPSLGSSEPKSM